MSIIFDLSLISAEANDESSDKTFPEKNLNSGTLIKVKKKGYHIKKCKTEKYLCRLASGPEGGHR